MKARWKHVGSRSDSGQTAVSYFTKRFQNVSDTDDRLTLSE